MCFIRRCLDGGELFSGLSRLGAGAVGHDRFERRVVGRQQLQNGNLLSAQIAKLSQAATIQSLSFYVTAASGNLILGIYDASGPNGGPGALKASTASFTPKTGWNTAKVVTPVSLPAGSYWLAFLPSSNALSVLENPCDRQLRILQLQV